MSVGMPGQPPAKWTITAQTQRSQPGPAGSFQRGVEIFFRTLEGHDGSVFVPNAKYTADYVTEAVAAAAANMDAIGRLTG